MLRFGSFNRGYPNPISQQSSPKKRVRLRQSSATLNSGPPGVHRIKMHSHYQVLGVANNATADESE
jgi:hypothetical protein